MSKTKDLTGMRFGKLIVLYKAPNISGANRSWGAWNCQCDCGQEKIVKTVHLNNGQVKSCGCSKLESKSELKVGDKVNRLTLLEYLVGKWRCLCDCGKEIIIITHNITGGNTKSCGCLKEEVSRDKAGKLIEGRRQYEPRIATARRVWKGHYCYNDADCTITFDEFLLTSQQDCFYCDIAPSTAYNYFLTESSRSSEKAQNEGLFVYNGLDRIDSQQAHITGNVVACCYDCNRSKCDRTVEEFLGWIRCLQPKDLASFKILTANFPSNKYAASSVRRVFHHYHKDSDLSLEEFYSMSQMDCFYCGVIPSNRYNWAENDSKSSSKAKAEATYIYNGLDRIDRDFRHDKNNVVPCCYFCNFAKGKLTLAQFYDWIRRVQSFQAT